jgi:predicted NUDIX family phosphoesterase
VETLDILATSQWRPRPDVEQDESLLQPIAYLMLCNARQQFWCYQRRGGDERLDARYSCGVGGHVDEADSVTCGGGAGSLDADATVRHALLRELGEELHATPADLDQLTLRGLIYEGHSPIGRVHLGVLYTAKWLGADDPRPRADEALCGLGFRHMEDILRDPRFELWSRLAVGFVGAAP